MIVYLVTSGRYSSYQTEGVFSSEEKAQEYIDLGADYEWAEEPRIEEWEVDEWKPRDIFWRVRFDGESGDLIEARQIPESGEYACGARWQKNLQTGQWVYETVFANRDSSRERAIKSAYEGMMMQKDLMRRRDPKIWAELTSD